MFLMKVVFRKALCENAFRGRDEEGGYLRNCNLEPTVNSRFLQNPFENFLSAAGCRVSKIFTRMRLSWRLLLLRTYLQKPTSFSYRMLPSSISSPFQTQSRITHTQTTNSREPTCPYGSFEYKIGPLDFSPAHGVTKKERDELEKDLKSVEEKSNAIEKEMDELEEDLKAIADYRNEVEEKSDELEEDLKSVAENRNEVEEKSDELEEDLKLVAENRNTMMAILEERIGYDLEEALKEIAEFDAMMAEESEIIWDSCYREAVGILIEFSDEDDIKRELNHLEFDQDLIKNVLEGFESNPNVARRFFHFLLHRDGNELDYACCSALYNSMLCVFGVNHLFGEFWELAEFMNTKRWCLVSVSSCKERRCLIHIDTWEKVSEFYCKHGLASELQKLNMLVVIQYMDNRLENIAHLLNLVWPEMSHDMISVQVYGDFVKLVLEHTSGRETLTFLRWIAGCDNLGKLNEQTCDFIASVLGKEDDKYSNLVDHLKMSGDDSEGGWPVSRQISEFYEYAVACSNTVPSVNCCIYLIMKIRLYDIDLCGGYLNPNTCRVIRAFEKKGGILTDSDVSDVINMLVRSGNKIRDLYNLADQAIHSTYLEVPDRPFSFTWSYREGDRQRRARLMFSELQNGISGENSYNTII